MTMDSIKHDMTEAQDDDGQHDLREAQDDDGQHDLTEAHRALARVFPKE